MEKLTKRQEQVLRFISDFISEKAYSPSITEICEYFDYKSPKAASDMLNVLENKGFIKRTRGRSRSIELKGQSQNEEKGVTVELIIASDGNSQNPLSIFLNPKGKIEVPISWIGEGNYFAVLVGDSGLENEGILENDLVICEQKFIQGSRYFAILEKGRLLLSKNQSNKTVVGTVKKILRDY